MKRLIWASILFFMLSIAMAICLYKIVIGEDINNIQSVIMVMLAIFGIDQYNQSQKENP